MPGPLKKGNVSVTLSINRKIYGKYKEFCNREGLLTSRQVERFMKKHSAGKKDRNVLDSILGK